MLVVDITCKMVVPRDTPGNTCWVRGHGRVRILVDKDLYLKSTQCTGDFVGNVRAKDAQGHPRISNVPLSYLSGTAWASTPISYKQAQAW